MLVTFSFLVFSVPEEVRAKPGEDVLLQCNGPTGAAITKIKWEKPDLEDRSVFFFRDNTPYKIYQDPRYHGRVELKDPAMKNGDASVVLKNVKVNDTGVYQCWVTTPNMPGEMLHSVQLVVSEGTTKGHLEQLKEQSKKLHTIEVLLGVGLGLGCLLVVGVACFALRRFVCPKPKSGPV
ncbi:coxsackievirus and adenovirus receptor-like [Gymnodraco acuticeps]|uniref:Coxsackievirus and adenovirus receptor-like n=1 Tax=Gymnodraco acuticeps TaxID=8218 RepID=A0A6P8T5U3_GYMAC|nr:coxsackievirus and adenovirus receptor-like [Gymnodraco acuticeps]